MTMLSAILLAALAQASPPPPVPAPLPTAEAVALFRLMCVNTLPDPMAFARLLDPATNAWPAYENPRREPGVAGNYWRAAQGQLAYLYRRNEDGSGPYPSCEVSFLTAPDFSQEAAAGALTTALGLGPARRDGDVLRWETRLANGTEARLALAPSDELGGPAARLSIFAHRLPPDFE